MKQENKKIEKRKRKIRKILNLLPFVILDINGSLKKIDAKKETVIVACHEASRTGAPILGLNIITQLSKKYNVIALLLGGGEMHANFCQESTVVINLIKDKHLEAFFPKVLSKILATTKIKFAIVNSAESRSLLPAFAKEGIATLALVHEFATYTKPDEAMSYIFKYADQMVFSAKVVRDDAIRVCEELKTSEEIILPQGRCVLPTENSSEIRAIDSEKIREVFGDENHDDDVIRVVGMGTVDLRKGVDLFIACAHKVKQKAPKLKIKFIWIGSGYSSTNFYALLLQHQIKCSYLEDTVQIMGAVTDLESVYKKTDLFLLSSRLDPLPNVGIDALVHGIPTICFDETTGLAGILKEYGQEKYCVVDYLALEQAANNIIELATSRELRKKIGDDLAIKAKKTFDMSAYVHNLDSLAAGIRH